MVWRAGPTREWALREAAPCLPGTRHQASYLLRHLAAPPLSLPLSTSPEMANPQRFLGSSLVAWQGLSLPISQPWHLSLMFRTRQADGVLLQAVTRGRSTITLQVMHRAIGAGGPWPGLPPPPGGWSERVGRVLFFLEMKRLMDWFGGSLLPSMGPK